MAPNRRQKAVESERDHKLKLKIQSLRRNMAKVRMDQQRIREGQIRVRERFAIIKRECDQLREETNLILNQACITKIRVAFMFLILRARRNGDLSKAAKLTYFLRSIF